MKHSPRKTVAIFLLTVAVSYGLLVGLGPSVGLHKLSTAMYGKVCKALFSEMGENGIVVFDPVKGNVSINDEDYQLTLINKELLEEVKKEARESGSTKTKTKVKAKNVFINFWQYGFVPSALLIALILATPLPWKRKLWALAIAWLVLQVFVVFRVYLTILNHFQQIEWLAIYDFSEAQNNFLYFASEKLLYFGSILIAVVFIWLLSISGSSEFKRLRKALFAES